MTDYIIVGAGSAGCVLAARLSENPGVEVTLIEAGGNDKSFLYSMPAGYAPLMANGKGNWKYSTVPQKHLNNRSIYFPRGKVLGGSSSINGLVFVRGNRADFDGWGQMGARGWDYESCLPYFKKMEAWSGGGNEWRGEDGPIGVMQASPLDEMSPISRAWMIAGEQAGHPVNEDANGADQHGFSRCDSIIKDGVRQSTSQSYLNPAKSRPNLKVVTNALVQRITVENGRATGVEIHKAGRSEILHADQEVILCGGAVNSPQLLMLSGIGPAEHLRSHGITPVADLAGVGDNLQDHLSVQVQQDITEPYSALAYTKPHRAIGTVLKYLFTKKGPAAANGLEVQAFLKTDSSLETPDLQYHFPLLMYNDYGRDVIQHEGFAAVVNATRPRSTGNIKLKSASPSDHPLIDPNYLSDPHDMHVLKESVRVIREVISQPAFDEFRGPERAPAAYGETEEDLEEWIRNTACTMFHPVGTCRIGSDDKAVVDSELAVHGIEGLRVVDASVMPTVVSGNTNAAVIMIAEKASDTIIAQSR